MKMRVAKRSWTLVLCMSATWIGGAASTAQESPSQEAAGREVVNKLQAEAHKLESLVNSDVAKAFLQATAHLPAIEPRVIHRDLKKNLSYTEAEFAALTESQQAGLEQRTYDTEFYYYTGYGSPLVYVRLLELAARHGVTALSGKRVLDFGYGSIGQMRLMASLGADAVGCEVHPVLRALYSEPGDQGVVNVGGEAGRIALIDGSWPGDDIVRKNVGGGFDLLTSKNTLKRGYIHPEREVDPRFLVHLGVDDETFVRRMFEVMNPGGLVLIYNLSPAQNPLDEKYLPHADGRCPFDRDLLERIGFEVIAYDEEDHEAAYDIWFSLGYNNGETREQMRKSLFAHYTLMRRP